MIGYCGCCKYYDKDTERCRALPPVYIGNGRSFYDDGELSSWQFPLVAPGGRACSLYQPKEDVPALGESLGEQP